MLKRLAYVRTGWLPTRQANGIQTVRMCEAFAKLGAEVSLYYISSPVLRDDIFKYYGVATPFGLKTLPRAILPLRKSFTWQGWRWFPMYVHAFLWSGLMTYLVRRGNASLFFTREAMVAWWLGYLGLPTVLEIHTSPSSFLDRNILQQAATRQSVKLIVSVTEHLRHDLIRTGIPQSKVITLHDGVDMNRFNGEISKNDARQHLGLPLDRDLVIYTGQLSAEKGVHTLVRAALILTRAIFILVGGQPEEIDQLQNLTKKTALENIIFAGYVSPLVVPFYLKAADVLVIPQSSQSMWSSYYTSPLKLFEYMASGRAIVATNVPCITEVLRHGQHAWLVETDDPLSLAEGIRLLLADRSLRDRLSSGALDAATKFSWDNRARTIIDEFGKHIGAY